MKKLPTITVNFYKCLKMFLTDINPESIKGDSAYRAGTQKSADSTKAILRRMADTMQEGYTNALIWGFSEHRATPADVSAFINRLLKNACKTVDEAAHGNLSQQQIQALIQNDPAKTLEAVYAYKNN